MFILVFFSFSHSERIHQAQAAAAKARKALQQKPKPASKPVSVLPPFSTTRFSLKFRKQNEMLNTHDSKDGHKITDLRYIQTSQISDT